MDPDQYPMDFEQMLDMEIASASSSTSSMSVQYQKGLEYTVRASYENGVSEIYEICELIEQDSPTSDISTLSASKNQNEDVQQYMEVLLAEDGLETYKCIFCNKVFEHYFVCEDHIKQTHQTGPHRCGQCSRVFTKKHTFLSHIKIHSSKPAGTTKPAKMSECAKCKKQFKYLSYLQRHVLVSNKCKDYYNRHKELDIGISKRLKRN